MGKSADPAFRIGEYWLAQRPGKSTWYRTWYDTGTKATRRASLGTTEFEEAKKRLTDWFVLNNAPDDEDIEDVLLADVIRIYYEEHGQHTVSHEAARLNLGMWLDFFEPATTVEQATRPKEIDRFIRWLDNGNRSNAYINRILTSGRSAINRAWKQGLIKSAPFIKSLPTGASEPQGRPMSIEELRLFYHTSKAPHLKSFILWTLGTASRPQAIQDLHEMQIDQERGLIHLNPPGREQTKKHRPTVRLPSQLRPFIREGFQVQFRGKPVAEIKTSWRNQRAACGFDAKVNPYSLRHTMARHLRASSVPAWEVAAQLGHKKRDMSVTEIYAPYDPAYLSKSVEAIDQFLEALLVSPDDKPLMSCPSRVHHETGEADKSLKSLERAMRFSGVLKSQ